MTLEGSGRAHGQGSLMSQKSLTAPHVWQVNVLSILKIMLSHASSIRLVSKQKISFRCIQNFFFHIKKGGRELILYFFSLGGEEMRPAKPASDGHCGLIDQSVIFTSRTAQLTMEVMRISTPPPFKLLTVLQIFVISPRL